MKPFILLLSAAFLSTASLSACSESNKMSIQQQTEARFKLNPEPKQAYRVRIKINDAPGPMKLVSDLNIGYIAPNCSYVISRLAGARANPEKKVSSKIDQIGQDEYESIFYLDAVLDEDYFGKGVCHWQTDGFGFAFKASGKLEETRFSFGDFVEDLLKKKTMTKYYWKGAYPYLRKEDGTIYDDGNTVSFGADSPDGYGYDRQKDLFTITVTLEEVK